MKATVSLRLTEERAAFRVFFPYSDGRLRTALLGSTLR